MKISVTENRFQSKGILIDYLFINPRDKYCGTEYKF